MYWAARRHFGEAAARAALLAGAFWYELVGFAHKPMTEFVATAPLLALLALCLRPTADGSRVVWQAAGLALVAILLLAHSLQAHKEYRFIFAVIPLWLLIAADLATRAAAWAAARVRRTAALRWAWSVAGAGCLAVSLPGC